MSSEYLAAIVGAIAAPLNWVGTIEVGGKAKGIGRPILKKHVR